MTKEHEFVILAAFGPALITGVASYLAAIYTVRKGPDYQQELNDLKSEVGRMSSAYEATLEHQRQIADEDRQRREAHSWRPEMEIQSDPQGMTNTLYVHADRHFSIETVRLKTNSGAVVATLDGDTSQAALRAEFSIPPDAVMRLVERDGDYLRNEKTVCRLECVLRVGVAPRPMTFEFAFRVMQDAHRGAGGLTIWRRLEGRL
jgi:hypothetical protein